ncbi:conserved hypothetical protein [Culex quinquefasciatus]|uniref:Uncharacterized protein n=1 Tax=Culex quinquefasciatus TaxID=7176 RepID=B0X2C7_CULQU|nr:conserved hypothetical protein [Culex quinquefasciatus]|eukprot:XP_001863799.1 conserved hypothetical protein [Culex quinquefasciatus]
MPPGPSGIEPRPTGRCAPAGNSPACQRPTPNVLVFADERRKAPPVSWLGDAAETASVAICTLFAPPPPPTSDSTIGESGTAKLEVTDLTKRRNVKRNGNLFTSVDSVGRKIVPRKVQQGNFVISCDGTFGCATFSGDDPRRKKRMQCVVFKKLRAFRTSQFRCTSRFGVLRSGSPGTQQQQKNLTRTVQQHSIEQCQRRRRQQSSTVQYGQQQTNSSDIDLIACTGTQAATIHQARLRELYLYQLAAKLNEPMRRVKDRSAAAAAAVSSSLMVIGYRVQRVKRTEADRCCHLPTKLPPSPNAIVPSSSSAETFAKQQPRRPAMTKNNSATSICRLERCVMDETLQLEATLVIPTATSAAVAATAAAVSRASSRYEVRKSRSSRQATKLVEDLSRPRVRSLSVGNKNCYENLIVHKHNTRKAIVSTESINVAGHRKAGPARAKNNTTSSTN